MFRQPCAKRILPNVLASSKQKKLSGICRISDVIQASQREDQEGIPAFFTPTGHGTMIEEGSQLSLRPCRAAIQRFTVSVNGNAGEVQRSSGPCKRLTSSTLEPSSPYLLIFAQGPWRAQGPRGAAHKLKRARIPAYGIPSYVIPPASLRAAKVFARGLAALRHARGRGRRGV